MENNEKLNGLLEKIDEAYNFITPGPGGNYYQGTHDLRDKIRSTLIDCTVEMIDFFAQNNQKRSRKKLSDIEIKTLRNQLQSRVIISDDLIAQISHNDSSKTLTALRDTLISSSSEEIGSTIKEIRTAHDSSQSQLIHEEIELIFKFILPKLNLAQTLPDDKFIRFGSNYRANCMYNEGNNYMEQIKGIVEKHFSPSIGPSVNAQIRIRNNKAINPIFNELYDLYGIDKADKPEEKVATLD